MNTATRFVRTAGVVFVAVAAASQAQVINGGFEQPGLGFRSVGSGQTYGNWTNAGPGDIEFVHAVPSASLPGLEFSAYEGRYWIDLVGVGAPSAIYQDLSGLTPGGAYRVSFAMAGNVWGPNMSFTMQVVWNGLVVGTFTQVHGGSNGANMNWQDRSVDVVAGTAATNRLMFRATSGGSARGPALDAVGIALIPTPGTAGLLLMGGGLLTRRRR